VAVAVARSTVGIKGKGRGESRTNPARAGKKNMDEMDKLSKRIGPFGKVFGRKVAGIYLLIPVPSRKCEFGSTI